MHAEHTELAQQRLTRKAWRLADKVATVRDHGFSPRKYRRRVRDESPARLAGRVRDLRRALKDARQAERRRARAATADASASPTLEAIAACESGGNPATDTGNGFYGKYQFTLQTWASVGGTGNPAAASEAEQNRRAAALYAREGASPWPVCGR
ncbi:transglycosylase family protein [Solirubrobacter soli]|uniref:transglycosylase family protein n=1 Tax=Solirubrobacter soli TaxID=363832 RepID=UPI0004036A66|nr:transglycosylase family protein [Solirubrobacter soli]